MQLIDLGDVDAQVTREVRARGISVRRSVLLEVDDED